MATLTAPIRRLGHTVRGLAGLGLAVPRTVLGPVVRNRRRPPWPAWPPEEQGGGGVREPRRPRPTLPAGAMALPEPTAEPSDSLR